MSGFDIHLISLSKIKRTENIDQNMAASIVSEMSLSGFWTHPLLLDSQDFALMDGHHRLHAAKQLKLVCVPAVSLSYDDPVVKIESWRPGESYTPEQIRNIAKTGNLLPHKTTRHVIDAPLPRCRISLELLRDSESAGQLVLPATPQATRAQLLTHHYHQLGREIGIRTLAAEAVSNETSSTQAPHPRLRQMLQNDPAMAALIPASTGKIALGSQHHSPFYLLSSDLLLLSPVLLENPSALAVAARWGLEVTHTHSITKLDSRHLISLLRYGAALIAGLPTEARTLFLDSLPSHIAAELWSDRGQSPTKKLFEWFIGLIEAQEASTYSTVEPELLELEQPLEFILQSGGDSRLNIDSSTGFNRYGVPPRPRPEAIQFSSSTASAISDYGFLFCDLLRRDLLCAELQDGVNTNSLRSRVSQGISAALLSLLSLKKQEADVVVTASGTDTELVSVMLGLTGKNSNRLTNILVSPEESGRGVLLAGSGCFFDNLTCYGRRVVAGQKIWNDTDIEVKTIAIRDVQGSGRSNKAIDDEFFKEGSKAISEGRHVLAHLLATSKTGLSAPSIEVVDQLVALAPDQVDVVVDACQMRWDFARLGSLVRRGWSIQISGSKFLTGPPFSGALVVPVSFRERANKMRGLISNDPGTTHPQDWPVEWAMVDDVSTRDVIPSYGPLFRWLPAILEAQLFNLLPVALKHHAFDHFRAAITERISNSRAVELIDIDSATDEVARDDALARHSIVCFRVLASDWNGQRKALDEAACRRLFELLNSDISDQLGSLTPANHMVAIQQSHVGQPVTLNIEGEPKTVLRLVLGARFFTIVGHAGPGSIEAALQSQIADACRAIDKLELLAENWWRLN